MIVDTEKVLRLLKVAPVCGRGARRSKATQIYSDASSSKIPVQRRQCTTVEKLEKIPAWQLTKVGNKKEMIDEARNEGRKVHFASLMDLCHLKNSELDSQFQNI